MIINLTPDLERILDAGNNAPSGENCQPWHFVVRGNTIEVHLLPERDQSAYGWGQRGSYIANGAVIENIVIAASAEQYRADVQYFPTPADEWHVATIILTKDLSIIPDQLAMFIRTRVSNRKPYNKDSLTAEERNGLMMVAPEGDLSLIENPDEIKKLGRVGSTNEEVMLGNHALHNFFFNHVNWTKEEDDEKKIGFYIKTLELPPPARVMFKIFRNWSIMRFFIAMGFTRVIAKQNGEVNASASAIGALAVDSTEPLDFVKIGRTIERLWLTATSLGLAFQPIAGILFFKLRIIAGEDKVFSAYEKKLIMDAYRNASEICGAGDKHLAFMFRVGHGEAPSAHAIRFPLADAVTVV